MTKNSDTDLTPIKHRNSDDMAFEEYWKITVVNPEVNDVTKGYHKMTFLAALTHERKRSERLLDALEKYSDSEHDYWVERVKTNEETGEKVYIMKDIVQLSKLARQALKDYKENL